MSKLLLPKYSFADITVLMKVGSDKAGRGIYLNLTDLDITEGENEKLCLDCNVEYALMFFSFAYYKYKGQKGTLYACEITIEELMALAGIQDKNFFKKFVNNQGDNVDLLATLCAKKIVDYQYGKALQNRQKPDTYGFYRKCYNKDKEIVFQKEFFEV